MAGNVKILTVRYPWFRSGMIRVAGYSWVQDIYTEKEAFAGYILKKTASVEEFLELAVRLNGQFSILVEKSDEVWIFCGASWSYPVFYTLLNSGPVISDDPVEILKVMPAVEMQVENKAYFLTFGVTPGKETLVRGLHQVRPGEVIRIATRTGETKTFSTGNSTENTSGKTADETASFIRSIFRKYAGFLQNRKVLIPLTSGYDSRLLACLLKENGHQQVTCATWGRSSGSEGVIPGQVADRLGFPWHFIPYEKLVRPGFWNDEIFSRYMERAGHFSSMPYLQDYFALRYMRESGLIDDDTVVLPGHPGDFLRGSHLHARLPVQNRQKVAELIISLFGTSLPLRPGERDSVTSAVTAVFNRGDLPFSPVESFEKWDFEERQAKFISNSSQVYDFFRIRYLMPLFDLELIRFFVSLPFFQRLGASLYYQTLEQHFFKPLGCDFFHKPAGVTPKEPSEWKTLLLKTSPSFIREWYYPVKDDAYYREITRELMAADPERIYRKPLKSHYFNGYLTQWYFARVQDVIGDFRG
jgi:asparagine synthase (glutamine-hydrolysing)